MHVTSLSSETEGSTVAAEPSEIIAELSPFASPPHHRPTKRFCCTRSCAAAYLPSKAIINALHYCPGLGLCWVIAESGKQLGGTDLSIGGGLVAALLRAP